MSHDFDGLADLVQRIREIDATEDPVTSLMASLVILTAGQVLVGQQRLAALLRCTPS